VRKLALIMLLAAAAFGLVACGGDDEPTPSGGGDGEDVNQILERTFSDSSRIESGNLQATISGGQGNEQANATLSGPFESQGDQQLPLVALKGSFSSQGEEFEAGVVNTGEKGYVSFQGEDYEVSGPVYEQFKAAYEQAATQGGAEGQSLSSLGLNPRDWLTDPKLEGDADVGGTETSKITGGVDVAAVLDDINAALEKMRSLGLDGSAQLPEQITPQQKQQAIDAVEDARVEVYSGKDDNILRRLKIDLTAEGSTVTLDLTLTGVNEDQDIPEPADARPFSELAEQLGGLGLGGLGGSGGGGGANGGGADAQALEKYSQCVQDAAGDSAKTARCADLLTP
jgi:hypothetical protein